MAATRDQRKRSCAARHHQLGARPGSSCVDAADDRGRDPVGLSHHQLGRGCDLVGDRDHGRVQLVAGRVVDGRGRSRSTSTPAAPIATFVIPSRHERPNVSVTITPSERPVRRLESRSEPRRGGVRDPRAAGRRCRRRAHSRRRRRPTRRRTRGWSRRSRAAAGCGGRGRTRGGHLEPPRVAVAAGEPIAASATARPRPGGRRAPRPSRRPSGRRRRRRRRAARPRRDQAARSSPSVISGSPSTGRTSITRASPAASRTASASRRAARRSLHQRRRDVRADAEPLQPLPRPRRPPGRRPARRAVPRSSPRRARARYRPRAAAASVGRALHRLAADDRADGRRPERASAGCPRGSSGRRGSARC